MVKVLIVEPDGAAIDMLVGALGRIEGVILLGTARTLSAAYHLSEHRRPTVALVSHRFAAAEEIEVMALLFRALGTAGVFTLREAEAAALVAPRARALGWKVARQAEADLRAVLGATAVSRPGGETGGPGRPDRPLIPSTAGRFDPARIVLIGASTGGVDALVKVLRDFPADCPPTVIVQHTGAGFSEGLVRLLDRQALPRVVEARHRQRLEAGTVVVAPGVLEHLVLSPREPRLQLRPDPPVSGHRPSIDRLFQGALPVARSVTAVLLTGMGRDGAQGLTDLRHAGAFTIAQDRASSVVYGMPRVAKDLGGVISELPLARIGPAILASCRRSAA